MALNPMIEHTIPVVINKSSYLFSLATFQLCCSRKVDREARRHVTALPFSVSEHFLGPSDRDDGRPALAYARILRGQPDNERSLRFEILNERASISPADPNKNSIHRGRSLG